MNENEVKQLETRVKAAQDAMRQVQADRENVIKGASTMHTGNRSDSFENRLLKSVGLSDISQVMTHNLATDRFKLLGDNERAALLSLKRDFQIARLVSQVYMGEEMDGEYEKQVATGRALKTVLDNPFAKSVDLGARLKAFGTGVSGEGQEWVPTMISNTYIEEYELERQVSQLMRQVNMPSNPFKLPVQNNVTIARKVAEGAEATGSSFGTIDITFDATKLYEYYPIPEELQEDAVGDFVGLARDEVVRAQIRALETMIINGDVAGTHQDSDVTVASDARKVSDGLRKKAIANSANGSLVDFGGAAVTKANLDKMQAALGKFGLNARELAWIPGSTSYLQMKALTEVSTVEKFGPSATILRGALEALNGIGIFPSEFMRSDMTAAGVYDGVTTDFTGLILVNTRRFYVGMRRPIRIRAARDARPEFDRWQLVSYQRVDFQGHAQGANETSVVYGNNILA